MPKTLAIRLDDDLHAAASAVAQLQGTSMTELIRTSIETYLSTAQNSAELADKAEALLAEIDADAAARRRAIEGLLGPTTAKPAGRGRKATQEAS